MLAAVCFVAGDFHEPGDPGFVPNIQNIQPQDSDLGLMTTLQSLNPFSSLFAKESANEPIIIDLNNNRDNEFYKQSLLPAFPQLGQLCSINGNCGQIGSGKSTIQSHFLFENSFQKRF